MHLNTLYFNDSCIAVYFQVDLIEFVTWPPFSEMQLLYDAAKGGQIINSKKLLKVYCYAAVIKVFGCMASPE